MKWLSALIVLTALLSPAIGQPTLPFQVPSGFSVSEFAGDELVHDIFSMTIDAKGRVIVSGPGYIRSLVDVNAVGKADRAVPITGSTRQGAMGLLIDGDDLFAVVDGGVRRFQLEQSGVANGPSELVFPIKTGGEHDAHAIRRGRDGWFYLLCGNMSGVSEKHATLRTSPIKKPIAGALLRISPDFRESEILAHGFRNAYDFDFDSSGEPWTYDSDNERCVGLPWYEGARVYRIQRGGFHGWLAPQLSQTWRFPPYFPDVVSPVVDLGRGSPTGVAFYHQTQFPEKYSGGLFLADWTFGRIWFVRDGKAEIFLEPRGDVGFAPTALAVHPQTGELYVSIGGRGTRGSIYRIRYERDTRAETSPPKSQSGSTSSLTPASLPEPDLQTILRQLQDPVARLLAIRQAQRLLSDIGDPKTLGTAFEGYTRRDAGKVIPQELVNSARLLYPTGVSQVDRELLRLFAMMEDDSPETLSKVLDSITRQSHATEDIHALIVAARLKAKRSESDTAKTAQALVQLDGKYAAEKLARDRFWPIRVAEIHAELAKKDPNLNAAILGHAAFAQAGNVILTRCPGFDRRAAAERFVKASIQADFHWSSELVLLLGSLPSNEYRLLIGKLWERGGFEDELLSLISQDPRPEDRPRLLDGLRSRQISHIAKYLGALERLPQNQDTDELIPLIRTLRALPEGKAENPLREQIGRLLAKKTGETHGTQSQAWADWLSKAHPELSPKLGGSNGVNEADWKERIAKLSWTDGDTNRGKTVFTKATCANCHSGNQALGPDLRGITSRFSREDLLTAILQPSKDISPRYRMTQFTTTDGKVYQGIIIYEANDGTILQTGPASTVRIDGQRIESRSVSETSLMPAGLLDRMSNQEIVDLFAYLKTLK